MMKEKQDRKDAKAEAKQAELEARLANVVYDRDGQPVSIFPILDSFSLLTWL